MGNSNSGKKGAKQNRQYVTPQSHVCQTSFVQVPHAVTTVVPVVPPPKPFGTEDEFCRLWFSWRKAFLAYISSGNRNGIGDSTSADKLLNCLGPVGIEISRTFTFMDPLERADLDALLKRFDLYCIFGRRNKQPQENAYQYIKDLRVSAKRYFPEEEEIVRSKVTLELKEWCASHSHSSSLLLSPSYAKLTLMEIANWWRVYERKFHEERKWAEKGSHMVIDCKDCGNDHAPDACPAKGNQCTNCKEQNHVYRKCPQRYITDCARCGDSHLKRQCPAYHETCSKCKRRGHFQRKCQPLQCHFCGQNHIANRDVCPAVNALCTNCHRRGHFAAKCHKGHR